jgi:hypothetical protein
MFEHSALAWDDAQNPGAGNPEKLKEDIWVTFDS